MIIRIDGEGRYRVTAREIAELDTLDAQLLDVADTDDDAAFTDILDRMRDTVRRGGAAVPGTEQVADDLVLPSVDTAPSEIRAILQDEGLISGN
ncbi:PspA-associated protein PspAA [Nocardia arizonensis]|uniref:PspA-associated protein PspAA n=1 Tax=Nocardia arizonensis TaxID=1141647 RepID=UPI0006D039D5|nr:hypothetical protein [Nocardia arizonensis]